MSLVKRGNAGALILQPKSWLETEQDGLIRGQRILKGDIQYAGQAPSIGDPHPLQAKALCYHVRIENLTLSNILVVANYIGIMTDPTTGIIEFAGALNKDPIESHPKFVSDLAGTATSPLNNAVFNDDGTFAGFVGDGTTDDNDANSLIGTDSYFVPGANLRSSWWTYIEPSPAAMGSVFGIPANITMPRSVKNCLCGPFGYRQVGKLYQVTQELLGSGPAGWNKLIYGDAQTGTPIGGG